MDFPLKISKTGIYFGGTLRFLDTYILRYPRIPSRSQESYHDHPAESPTLWKPPIPPSHPFNDGIEQEPSNYWGYPPMESHKPLY